MLRGGALSKAPFLPSPYRPDFNPTETALAKLKRMCERAPHHHWIVTCRCARAKAGFRGYAGPRMETEMSLKAPESTRPGTPPANDLPSNSSAIAACNSAYARHVEDYLEWVAERSAELRAELAKPKVVRFGGKSPRSWTPPGWGWIRR